MEIKSPNIRDEELTLLGTKMLKKDATDLASESNAGFIYLANDTDINSNDDTKAVTSKLLNKKVSDSLKVIDGGEF